MKQSILRSFQNKKRVYFGTLFVFEEGSSETHNLQDDQIIIQKKLPRWIG